MSECRQRPSLIQSGRIACRLVVLCGGIVAAAHAAAELPITDPTRPPQIMGTGAAGNPALGLRLQSTQVSATSRSATIDNRIVTVGSRIGGAVVVAIEAARVTLQRGGERVVLRLEPPTVKEPAGERQ